MGYINRRSGMVHGGVSPYQQRVAQSWKGLQMLRAYSGFIGQTTSTAYKTVHAKIDFFANRFRHDLATNLVDAWNSFAATIGSAVDREANDNVATSRNIIPKRRKLMTGLDAYVGLNLVASETNNLMTPPLDLPPSGEQVPAAPTNVTLNYTGGTATVTWVDPLLAGTPIAKIVRLYAKFDKGHTQLITSLSMPTPQTFTFTTLRGGHSRGDPSIVLANEGTGILLVQMETVTARITGQAPRVGPSSNVPQFKVVN